MSSRRSSRSSTRATGPTPIRASPLRCSRALDARTAAVSAGRGEPSARSRERADHRRRSAPIRSTDGPSTSTSRTASSPTSRRPAPSRAAGPCSTADGAWLIPGLWDHHVHVVQWALAAQREPLGHAPPPPTPRRIMGDAPLLADGRRIGTGFRDALWSDAPSLAVLDEATGEVPTYLINADVHSVWLNTAALRREGYRARRRRDPPGGAGLRDLPAAERRRPGHRRSARRTDGARMRHPAASSGIVDLDMAWNEASWARRARRRIRHAARRVRHLPGVPRPGDRRGASHRRPRARCGSDLARVGSLKVITDGSLGTRTAACSHAVPRRSAQPRHPHRDPATLVELMTAAPAPASRARSTRSATWRTRTRSTPSPSAARGAPSSTRSSWRTPTSRASRASGSAPACSPSTRSTTAT